MPTRKEKTANARKCLISAMRPSSEIIRWQCSSHRGMFQTRGHDTSSFDIGGVRSRLAASRGAELNRTES